MRTSRPGVFGLVLAALTAALMSTVDTLITAVSAIVVNDIYKRYINPDAGERRLVWMGRLCVVIFIVAAACKNTLYYVIKLVCLNHPRFANPDG